MLALGRLLGVPYDGLKSPAGYLHADLMPVVRALTESRERVEQAGSALRGIIDDAVNRLTKDSPMLLIDVRKLDGVMDALSTPDSDRCPTCGLTVRIPASKGSHGCSDPWHGEEATE
jgi:hypothetical protein